MTEYDNSNPSNDEIEQAEYARHYEKIIGMITNMSEGEVFLFGSTFMEARVIQEDELHLMFCYHGEMHMARRDYGDEAYQLLDEIYRNLPSGDGGRTYYLTSTIIDRIKAIVDGPAEERNTGKQPESALSPESSAVTSAVIAEMDAELERAIPTTTHHDRTQGDIIIFERFGDKVIGITTPAKLLAHIDRAATGPVNGQTMSDYLVEAFDLGFAHACGYDAACFGWRLPTGEIIHQHST